MLTFSHIDGWETPSPQQITIIQEYTTNTVGTYVKSLLPGRVTLLSPSGTINTATPAYTWNADAHSTWYYLWVNDSTGTRIQKWYTAADAGCSSGTGTCAVTPDIALAAGSGKWWIDTWNVNGYGPWSNVMTFTVSVASGFNE